MNIMSCSESSWEAGQNQADDVRTLQQHRGNLQRHQPNARDQDTNCAMQSSIADAIDSRSLSCIGTGEKPLGIVTHPIVLGVLIVVAAVVVAGRRTPLHRTIWSTNDRSAGQLNMQMMARSRSTCAKDDLGERRQRHGSRELSTNAIALRGHSDADVEQVGRFHHETQRSSEATRRHSGDEAVNRRGNLSSRCSAAC